MRFLDPRFRLVAALIDDPRHSLSARSTARQHAEMIATQCGFTFADALKHEGIKLQPVEDPVAWEDEWFDGAEGDDGFEGDVERSESAEPADEDEAAVEDEPLPNGAGGQIAEALKADPGRSDRDIARECGVSPTTVGKTRQALGLGKAVRSVTRGGVAYDMQVGDRS